MITLKEFTTKYEEKYADLHTEATRKALMKEPLTDEDRELLELGHQMHDQQKKNREKILDL